MKMGESLFKQHCSPSHPGGNNVNPQKTLRKKDLEANGVKSASDIVGRMRNPDPDARAIAEYILKTF